MFSLKISEKKQIKFNHLRIKAVLLNPVMCCACEFMIESCLNAFIKNQFKSIQSEFNLFYNWIMQSLLFNCLYFVNKAFDYCNLEAEFDSYFAKSLAVGGLETIFYKKFFCRIYYPCSVANYTDAHFRPPIGCRLTFYYSVMNQWEHD